MENWYCCHLRFWFSEWVGSAEEGVNYNKAVMIFFVIEFDNVFCKFFVLNVFFDNRSELVSGEKINLGASVVITEVATVFVEVININRIWIDIVEGTLV